ncbi:MAG: PEP-CTERM sorting domain-containing protein [Crocosphaera sp.]|nr:PEP-CTERM sorting domain-containing protein [Crocosphaera sp.]
MLKFKQIIPGILVYLSFAVVSSVEAATVVNLDDDGNVTSISDIEVCISGAEICAKTQEELEENEIKIIDSYNVTFPLGSFDDIFGEPTQGDFDPSCDNGLCFWGDDTQASLAITEISNALNSENPIPSLIAGERVNFPPFLPNTRNFYRVPLSFDATDGITSRQGTHDSEIAEPWILDTLLPNSATSAQPYAGFEFIGRQTILPIPPDGPTVPEPSALIGIFFTGSSLLMAMKKKN